MRRIASAIAFCILMGSSVAQMPSPSIDSNDHPFSYFAKSTDQLGVAGAPYGIEITPEGFLYTGFGELMFFVGSEATPLTSDDGRVRTLEDGYLPIESFTAERDGLRYHFTMFSASLDKQPEGLIANFVRVTIENPTKEQRAAFLSTAVRFQTPQIYETPYGENRFDRPATPSLVNKYRQTGEHFDPKWTYSFDHNAFVRDSKVLYLFPESPKPVLDGTMIRRFNYTPNSQPGKMDVMPTTPVGAAKYSLSLAPGESHSFDFKMPLIPDAISSNMVHKLEAANFDDYRAQVKQYWQDEIARGLQIEVPEEKINNIYRTSMVNDLMSLNHVGNDWVQTVNQTHYHGFYLRDSSDFVHMYDVTGRPDLASRVLDFYARSQQPDGNFLSQKGQFDGWGQTLWIYGFHYRFTHDRAFAERVYPSVVKAIDWFEKATAADPLHLMPATDVKDNEFVPGHLTGYNFLALDGLQGAIALARGLGKTKDAERFQRDYDAFRKNFLNILATRAHANADYIPPALDGNNSGADWGNLLGVTPEPQLDPHSPFISATLGGSQSRYEEGISVYNHPSEGKFIHHYLTIKNMLTEVARGDQQRAIEELYSVSLHTSSTNSGFETSIRPWASRDFAGNLAPHGWFAAEYRNVLRAMLIREEDDADLHLLSTISPAWIGVGKNIKVEHAPTMFGEVSFNLSSSSDTAATFKLSANFDRKPRHVVLHLPWFMETKSVSADGKSLQISANTVELPATTKLVTIQWQRRANVAPLSFDTSVERFKAEYRQHYADYLRTGTLYPH